MGMRDNGHLARVQERAARTASHYRTDWVWPRWLEFQTDPACAAFVPPSPLPLLTNMTGRNWTMVGNVGSPARAVVDPARLVTPLPDGWSVERWGGAGDRWHL